MLMSNPKAKRGQWYARRAQDAKIVRVTDAQAARIVTEDPIDPPDWRKPGWLAVYFAPVEYVRYGEGMGRIKSGYIRPVWTWERGTIIRAPYTFDKVVGGAR